MAGAAAVAVGFLPRAATAASNLFELRARWFMSEKQRIKEQSEGRGRIESQWWMSPAQWS
jgi:hypothetical protein